MKRKRIPPWTALLLILLSAVLTFFSGSRKALMNFALFTVFVFLFEKYDTIRCGTWERYLAWP
jgi:hypothetical protein